MSTKKPYGISAAVAVALTLVFSGCGGESPESMLASAKDYMAKGDNKAATIQLKNALQQNPNLGEARFLLGKTLFNSGSPTEAEVELRKASELKYPAEQVVPLLAHVQLMLGQSDKIINEQAKVELSSAQGKADLQTTVGHAYLMKGKVESAQAAYDAALAAQPGYAPALIGQARIKAGRRDLAGALELLDTVLASQATSYEAWQLKGDLLYSRGDLDGSLNAYRKALEIKPDLMSAHSSLVTRQLAAGKVDEAGKQLEAMKKVAPTYPQIRYLQAQILYRQKNFKAAQEAVQQYLKVLPDNTLGLQLAGAVEYELKSYTLAESYLLKVLPRTPELGLARRLLIASYLRSGQPAKALATLQAVLDKIDGNSNMLALAGEVFMQNGDAERASRYYTKAAELDPQNAVKRTSVALSHLAKGEGDSALRELEQIASDDSGIKADLALIAAHLSRRQFDPALKAIAVLEKKQPDNPLVYNLRGTAQLGKGDVAEARRSFELAQAKNPLYFPAAASLANLDLADKKPEDARKRFEVILAKDAKNVQALLAIAELHARTGGKPDEVAALIDKAISANPAEAGPRIALINLYLAAKDTRKALSAAQEALGVFPDRPQVLEAVGRAQQAAEDYNQALATFGKWATLAPNSPRPYLHLAEVQVAAKDKTAAMRSLRKALTIKSDLVEAQRGIVLLDLDAGRVDEALAMSREVQKQRPRETVGYLLEGDIHTLKKNWKDAITVYRNGLKQASSSELAIKLYATLVAAGNNAEADRFADGYLKEHAKDYAFRLHLAQSANVRKDYAVACKHYRALLEVQPNNPAVLNNLAWSAARIKDPKAIEYAEKAYKLAPDQPAIIDTLGELLLDKGDTARALELAQKAAELDPQNPQIQFNLAKALVKAGKKDAAKKELDELAKMGERFPAQAEVGKLLQSL